MQSEENFSNEVRAWELVIPRGKGRISYFIPSRKYCQ